MKEKLRAYVPAGIVGLLVGLGIVAVAAVFVVDLGGGEEEAAVLTEDSLVGEREPEPDAVGDVGQPAVSAADAGADPAADAGGNTEDENARAIVVPSTTALAGAAQEDADATAAVGEEDDSADGADGAEVDANGGDDVGDEPDVSSATTAPAATTTTAPASTTTTAPASTTTTTPTTTAAPAATTTTTTLAPAALLNELDRVLNLLPDEIEDLVVAVEIVGDRLSFGVRSEQDADRLNEFLSTTTAAPYVIRLAG